ALGKVAGTILADIDVFEHLRFEAVVNGALLVKLTRGYSLIPFSKILSKIFDRFHQNPLGIAKNLKNICSKLRRAEALAVGALCSPRGER
ncbi:hypothetical protein, partial [Thermodesulfitimonas sp.]